MNQIFHDSNVLQLEEDQIRDALEKSRKYWYQLAALAYGLRDSGLIPEFINPRHALHRVPRLQPCSSRLQIRPFGISPAIGLCIEASSTWQLPAEHDCDKLEREISLPALLQLGTDTATSFSFTESVPWNSTSEENATGPSYLGLLTLGWCYTLSAQLVEMLEGDASIHYTSFETVYRNESPPHPSQFYVVDIGEVDERTARWWSAILAPNGWKATVRRTTKREFLTPWSVARACDTCLSVKHRGLSSSSSVLTPLSAGAAFEALVRFAHLHGLHSQFLIAFAIALTIPTHRFYGSSAKLPLPRAAGGKKLNAPIDVIPPEWMRLKDDLPYYMTLSCSSEVLMSTFCGAFWEPDIPRNLVSPWLHPVLNEVLGETPDPEILAFISAIRQPNLCALWIGAVTSGLGPEILRRVGGGRPPLDPLGFPWTRCPQSFMDVSGSGSYICENPEYILRADVWRLMRLPSTEEDNTCYQYRPSTPWTSCGASLLKDCSLRVTAHLECPRHDYQYDHWVWHLEDGTAIQDHGLSEQPILDVSERVFNNLEIKDEIDFKRTNLDQMASREASLDIFRWFCACGEGLPPENIYQDEWLREIWEDDEDAGEIDDCDLQEPVCDSKDRVSSWLNTVN